MQGLETTTGDGKRSLPQPQHGLNPVTYNAKSPVTSKSYMFFKNFEKIT